MHGTVMFTYLLKYNINTLFGNSMQKAFTRVDINSVDIFNFLFCIYASHACEVQKHNKLTCVT